MKVLAPHLIILILLSVILVSCGQTRVTLTGVAQAEKNTFSVKNTETASHATIPSTTLENTVTSTTTMKSTPASENANDYRLASVDVIRTLELLSEASIEFHQALEDVMDSGGDAYWLRMEDVVVFARLLAFELERTYPECIKDPEMILTLGQSNWEDWQERWRPDYFLQRVRCYAESGVEAQESDYFENLFADAFVTYLNQNGVELQYRDSLSGPAFSGTVHQVELDGDDAVEWVVRVHSEMFGGMYWLPLDSLPDGGYQRLQSDLHIARSLYPWSNGEDYEIELLDLTGNGLTDVVLSFDEYVGGHTSLLTLKVFMGTSFGLELLEDMGGFYSFSSNSGEYLSFTIDDSDNDTIPSIQIEKVQILPWECERKTITTYRWLGGIKRVTVEYVESKDAVCLLAQAVDSFSDGDIPEKITDIENALSVNEIEPTLSSEQSIFAHYRLALYYALMENDRVARVHLKAITDLAYEAPSEFATAISVEIDALLSQPTISPFALCQVDNSLFLPPLFIYSDNYRYQGFDDGYPRVLCPCSVSEEILSELRISPGLSPEAELRRIGISIILTQSIELADDASEAWIFVADYEDWRLLLTYDTENGWHVHGASGWLTTKPGEITWLNKDLTGDGQSDFALAYPVYVHPDSAMGIGCSQKEEQAYELFVSTGIGNGWTIYEWDYICLRADESLVLEDILTDQNQDGIIDILADNIAEDNSRDLLELIHESPPSVWISISYDLWKDDAVSHSDLRVIEQQVIQGENPSVVRSEIKTAIQSFPSDELASISLDAYLQYLLALSYELEGRDADAVREYFELWSSFPETLWSDLASSKLELLE